MGLAITRLSSLEQEDSSKQVWIYGSRTPSHHHFVTPSHRRLSADIGATPPHYHTTTPSHLYTVIPPRNHTIIPSYRHKITPSHHKKITPSHHHTTTKSHHHTTTPSYRHKITPSHHHLLSPSPTCRHWLGQSGRHVWALLGRSCSVYTQQMMFYLVCVHAADEVSSTQPSCALLLVHTHRTSSRISHLQHTARNIIPNSKPDGTI